MDGIRQAGVRLGIAAEAIETLVPSVLFQERAVHLSEDQKKVLAEAFDELTAAREAYGASLRDAGFPAPFRK